MIKDWLKKHRRSREWLAERTFVSKKTVDNWLSSPKIIPEDKKALIFHLMQADEEAEGKTRQFQALVNQVFSLEVTHTQFRAYQRASRDSHQTLEDWAVSSLDAMARDLTLEQVLGLPGDTSRLNEPQTPYQVSGSTPPQEITPTHLRMVNLEEAAAAAREAASTENASAPAALASSAAPEAED